VSTLHERLLDEIPGPPSGGDYAAALRAVVERHKPVPCRMPECGDPEHQLCAGCGRGISWPEGCPDTMAIAEFLGVPTGDETT